MQLNDPSNFGCSLRDMIWKSLLSKETTMKSVRSKLKTVDIPEEYWSDVFTMVRHNICNRITDPIEQAIEARCHVLLIGKLMNEEKHLNS